MRDSYCYLQGCTPIHYRFKFKLHTTEDKKYLGSAFLSAILLAKVTKQNGVEMERIIEDGLKGDSYTPFDPKSGECLIKISFQTAGRGAPWIIRFIASTSEPVTSESILKQTDSCGVTGVPGCKGCEMYNATAAAAALAAASTGIGPGGTMTADPTKQAVTMTELCHYDFPVKTYSKKAKITKILKGTDGVPTEKVSIVPHKITFHAHELGGTGTGSSNTSGTSNNGSSSGSNSSANGATATIATTAQVGGNGSGSGSGSNSIGSTVTTGGSVVGPLNSATTVVTAGMNSSVIVGSGCAPNGTISGSTSITGASLLGSGGAGGGPMGNDIGNDLAGIMAGSSGGGSVIARVGCGCNDSSSLIDEPIRLDPEQIQLYQRQQRQQQQQQRQQQPQQTQQPVGGPELGEELVDLHSPPRKYLCQIQSQIPIPMMGPTATQNDGGKVLWDTDFEATLNQIFESVASENGAFPLSRHLTKEDMQFVCNACTLPEYAGVQGAQLWISKAAAGVAKIRRLWDAQNPMLIAGFISKDCTQRILSQCQPGTFMLRFSSGDPGELIIAFVVANEAGNTFVEQSYLVQDNEELSEAVVVERVLENRLFLNGLDIMSSTTFTKELYRPRSRYSKLNSMPI